MNETKADSSYLWDYEWQTVTNQAGLLTVVQKFTRLAKISPGEKPATAVDINRISHREESEAQMNLILESGHDSTNRTELCAKYSRGWIYFSTNMSGPFVARPDAVKRPVTLISSVDNARVVMGVDGGPIFASTNAGVTWETITSPGKHSLPVVLGDAGCGIFAVHTIAGDKPGISPANQQANTLPIPGWYALTAGPDGSGTVAVGGSSQSAPILSIASVQNQVVVSWPVSGVSYVLQQNLELSSTNWTDVAVEPLLVNGFNRVALSADPPHYFFRLRIR